MNKKLKLIFILLVIFAAGWFLFSRAHRAKKPDEVYKEIKPFSGSVQSTFSTVGSVLPKNRLEIKPPVGGRVEEILVKEGQKVKTGETLAWMSSTERAALLDAARGQGEKSLEYWKDVYKAIPLISPIDGEVIVSKTQPGQTVTTSDAVIVLSDKLIVRAQVDETDIGKVKLGQEVVLSLDAYPLEKIKAVVDHIYYESKTVNNVTTYEVDLLPEETPAFFRSGMNATIYFVNKSVDGALLVPGEAVIKENGKEYVFIKDATGNAPTKRLIETGISDEKNIQVISGINPDDIVLVKEKKYSLPKGSSASSPFTPFGAKKKEDKQKN